MLLNLHKRSWMDSLRLQNYNETCGQNKETVGKMLKLAKSYHKVSFWLRGWPSGESCGFPI